MLHIWLYVLLSKLNPTIKIRTLYYDYIELLTKYLAIIRSNKRLFINFNFTSWPYTKALPVQGAYSKC